MYQEEGIPRQRDVCGYCNAVGKHPMRLCLQQRIEECLFGHFSGSREFVFADVNTAFQTLANTCDSARLKFEVGEHAAEWREGHKWKQDEVPQKRAGNVCAPDLPGTKRERSQAPS